MTLPVQLSTDELVRAYLCANARSSTAGTPTKSPGTAAVEPLTPRRFVQEAAWVVLCTGMSEAAVSRLFPQLADRLRGFNTDWLAAHAVAGRTPSAPSVTSTKSTQS